MKILKFTRWQKAITSSAIFFVLLSFFVAGGLDANYIVFKKNNLIASIGELFGFPTIEASISAYILILFIALFVVFGVIALFSIVNSVHSHDQTLISSKMFPYVILIGVGGFLVFFGVGSLFSIPEGGDGYVQNIAFAFESIFIALLAFIAIYAIVIAAYLFILALPTVNRETVNMAGGKKLDKTNPEAEESEKKDDKDIADSFDKKPEDGKGNGGIASVSGALIAGGGVVEGYDRKRVFPSLTAIDERFVAGEQSLPFLPNGLTTKKLVGDLQNYLATSCSLYYSLNDLAMFVSALMTTPLTILEGVSGTGKSSLPRYFAKFIGETAFFESIQMTYKDKDDLLGYFNDFTGVYFETEFLKRLYEASFRANRLNLMVLDEMNISRVEYYFAPFLSVLEFPEDERRIHLINLPEDTPTNLANGDLILTPNTRFVGTANTDDSTFAITDKVIDRAIVLDFEQYHEPIEFASKAKPTPLSYKDLNALATAARESKDFRLGEDEIKKFMALLSQADVCLGIKTGNRLLVQTASLVPVYASMRGDKEGALDYLFAFKVLRKAKGRVDMAYHSGLVELEEYVKKTYGEKMPKTIATIESELRRNR